MFITFQRTLHFHLFTEEKSKNLSTAPLNICLYKSCCKVLVIKCLLGLAKTDLLELSRYATSKKTYWIIKCSVCLALFCVSLSLFIDSDFIIDFSVSLLYGLPMYPQGKFILIKFSITKISKGANQQTPSIVNIVKRQIIIFLTFFYLETNSPWFSCCFPNHAALLAAAAVTSCPPRQRITVCG